jgi:hypothetical protein
MPATPAASRLTLSHLAPATIQSAIQAASNGAVISGMRTEPATKAELTHLLLARES